MSVGGADLLNDAFAHDNNAIREGHGFYLVMGHVDCGDLQLMAEVLDLVPG